MYTMSICTKVFSTLLLLAGSFATSHGQTLPAPPNTLPVGADLFMDKTEVSNLHWREFLHYIRRDSGERLYRQMLPDTLVWAQRNLPQAQISAPELTINYFRSEAYQHHPVVGISYEQAQAYAHWRSQIATQVMNQPRELEKRGLQGKRLLVEYRLPTEEEWMAAAQAGLSLEKHPWGIKKPLHKPEPPLDPALAYEQLSEPKLTFKAFRRMLRKAKVPRFHVVVQLPPKLFLAPEFPKASGEGAINTLGLVHLIGNVAEMTAGPGIAKGGSFMHTLEDSKITNAQSYYGPAPWLGVRYVATVRVEDQE